MTTPTQHRCDKPLSDTDRKATLAVFLLSWNGIPMPTHLLDRSARELGLGSFEGVLADAEVEGIITRETVTLTVIVPGPRYEARRAYAEAAVEAVLREHEAYHDARSIRVPASGT